MPHQLAPPLASTAKTAPFQPVAPCPSFSKYPRKSHSAFKPETQRPRLFDPGGHSPTRGLSYVQHWYMCSIERLFARMFVRLTCCVSCGIARARSFVCDRGRVRRGCGRAVAVVPWTLWPWLWRHVSHVVAVASVASWTWPRHGRDRVVFVSPSHGCDTPTNASVSNGFTS